MKLSKTDGVLALVSCALLVIIAFKWMGDRESRASTVQARTEPEEPRQPEAELIPAADPVVIREEVPEPEAASEAPVPDEAPPAAFHYDFLPEDLQPLATMVPQSLEAFDAATPAEQLQLGRDLLVHSIAVIQCATGAGPIPKGMVGDGDLSYVGRDGKWSFQINSSTFHLYEGQFPEYPEFIALLNSAYDDQMVPLPITVELPAQLAERIRLRAREAIGWL